MTRRSLAALAFLALAGCASERSFSDRLAGRDRVRGDAETVSVFGMDSRLEALPLAVGHCAKYGRSAQFARRIPGGQLFRCTAG